MGAQAGENAINGDLNTIVGAYAGSEGVVGDFNTFVGMRAGSKNAGDNNTFIGGFAGVENSAGFDNVFIGQSSGEFSTGSNNVFIGNGTGYNNDGWNNVFIGRDAGNSVLGSNKLIISNWDADSSEALIYGEFDKQILFLNGYLNGIKFLNSFEPDTTYAAEGNFLTFGHTSYSEDFIGYKNNTFYFLDSPGGGDVLNPDVIFGGNVQVGDSLNVYGTARFGSVGSSALVNDLGLSAGGVLTTNTSDKRLKTNVIPIKGGLDKVLKLNGYTFNWKNAVNSKNDAGMIAQEVLDIFPEAVFINPNDGYYGVNYSRFPALLVEAIKEQQKVIEEQENKILELEKRLIEIENKINH